MQKSPTHGHSRTENFRIDLPTRTTEGKEDVPNIGMAQRYCAQVADP